MVGNHFSLRRRMVRSYLMLALLPLIAAGILVGWFSFSNQTYQAYQAVKMHAKHVSNQVSEVLIDAERLLLSTTRFHDFLSITKQGQKNILLEILHQDSFFDEIALIFPNQPDNDIMVSKRHIKTELSHRQWLNLPVIKQSLERGKIGYGKVQIDGDTAEPYVYMALPLLDLRTGKNQAFLMARLRLQFLVHLLAQSRSSEHETLYLSSETDSIIAHPDISMVLRGEKFKSKASRWPQKNPENRYGIIASIEFQVSNLKLNLMAEQSVSYVYQPNLTNFQIFIIILALATIVALGIIRRAINSIILPIEQVTNAAKAIQNGNIQFQVQLESKDELGTLAQAFNAMTGKLNLSLEDLRKENENRRQVELRLQDSYNKQQELLLSLDSQVKERTQELQDKLIELERTQDGLIRSEKMASVGRLISGVAHELNTPIGIAISAVSLLQNSAQQYKQLAYELEIPKERIEPIMETSDESLRLIDDSLEKAANLITRLSRINISQAHSNEHPYKVCEIIDQLVNAYGTQYQDIKIYVGLICRFNTKLYGDPSILELLINNLLSNSFEHAGFEEGKPGQVTISVDCVDSHLQIEFTDNGRGISIEDSVKIFDPFYTASGWGQHSGLGLYICHTLVTNRLQGKIVYDSSYQDGARFLIDYPVELYHTEESEV